MVAVSAKPGERSPGAVTPRLGREVLRQRGGLAEDKSGEGKRRQAWIRLGMGIAEAVTGGPDRQGRGYDGAELFREWIVPGEDERAAEGATEGCRSGKEVFPWGRSLTAESVRPGWRECLRLGGRRIPERNGRTTEFSGGGRRNGAEKEYIEKMASSSQKCAAGLRGGGCSLGKSGSSSPRLT